MQSPSPAAWACSCGASCLATGWVLGIRCQTSSIRVAVPKTPATVLTARGVHGTKPNVSHFPRADNASVGTVAAHDRNVKMRNKDVLLVKD
jgi:hypothetical protein